jgi:hypothetical protein
VADINDPLPDLGHEALRQSVVSALAAGDDGYYLTDVLFDLLGGAMDQISALQAQVDALTPPTP